MEFSYSAPLDPRQWASSQDGKLLVRCNSDPNLLNLESQFDRVLSQSISESSTQKSNEGNEISPKEVWLPILPTQAEGFETQRSSDVDPFLEDSQLLKPREQNCLENYLQEMEQDFKENGFDDIPSSQETRNDESESLIPREHLNSICSNDIPRSQLSRFEDELKDSFQHLSPESLNALSTEARVATEDLDRSPLGSDRSFHFNRDSQDVSNENDGNAENDENAETEDETNADTQLIDVEGEIDATSDTIILFSQEEASERRRSVSKSSIHATDEEFPFVPLTFTSSIDLRRKLQARHIIPQTQNVDKPGPGGDQKVPSPEEVNKFQTRTQSDFCHDFLPTDGNSASKVPRSKFDETKDVSTSQLTRGTSGFSECNESICNIEPGLDELPHESQMVFTENLVQGYGISSLSMTRLLNRAPRIGLSRLDPVKPLHRRNFN